MRQDKQGRGELLGAGERIQTCAPPAGPPCRSTRPLFVSRCRANVAHIIQSWPDSGLGFQFKILRSFLFVPSSLRTFCITAEFRDLIRCREARNLRDAPHQRADLVARPFVFEYIYIYIYICIYVDSGRLATCVTRPTSGPTLPLDPPLVFVYTLQRFGNSNSHGARPVHLIITMIKWIRIQTYSV